VGSDDEKYIGEAFSEKKFHSLLCMQWIETREKKNESALKRNKASRHVPFFICSHSLCANIDHGL